MPGPIAAIGAQAAAQATSQGMGLLANAIGAKSRLRQANKLYKLETHYAKEMTDYQKMKDLQMWKETGPVGQAEQLELAGLNRGLIYGMGGAGGQTVGGTSGVGPPQGAEITGNIMKGMEVGLQMQLIKAQKENIEADTKAKLRQAGEGDAAKIDLAKTVSETENNILNGIVLKYAGEQAKQQWEIDRELGAEKYGAQANELEARKAAADLIVTLHENGTMKKLTDAQLNNLLKDIGLKTEQISARKLENAILELEKEMQTKLGLDKNSPGWIKMIGRLILGFMK